MKSQVFTIIPGTNGPIWLLMGVSILLLVMVGLFAWLAWSSRNSRFEISDTGLEIGATMYGRTIPVEAVVADGIRVVDLRRDHDLRPSCRTNGAGLPGYLAGWFKLRNGEKSLLFVTDKRHVVYVPTRDGYSVMMSVRRPEEFAAALQVAARAPEV
jgi:hypothetical protein